jgi:hypothetical protein
MRAPSRAPAEWASRETKDCPAPVHLLSTGLPMKKILPFLFAAALLAPAVGSAAAFEGKVDMKITSPDGKTMPMNFSVKQGLQRIEMEVQGMTQSMIMDTEKHQMTMLMPQQQMYMVMDIPDAQAQPQNKDGEQATLDKTGIKEKILGYDCEKYISKYKNTTTELWLTDQIGSFMGLGGSGPGMGGRRGGRGGAGGQEWEKLLKGKDLFPLRVVGKTAEGKENFRLDVTAVEKKSLPDSLFVPPAEYRKFDMGGMMKGMMPGGGR